MTPEDIKVIDLIISSDIASLLDQIVLVGTFGLDCYPATNQTMGELQELLSARKATRDRFRAYFETELHGGPQARRF